GTAAADLTNIEASLAQLRPFRGSSPDYHQSVGLSEHWLAVRVSEVRGGAAEATMRRAGLFVLGERQKWLWARGFPDATGTDELVTEIARGTGEPCIGAWVFDSDFGYVVGAAANG